MKVLLYPLLAQVALTFVVMFRMYSARVAEFKEKRIHPQSVPTRAAFREKITDSANSADNFSNLFETPVMFFVAIVLAYTMLIYDPLLLVFAWMYVGCRVVHSFIHCTYNTVMHRFYAFAASAIVLLALWVRLGWLIIQ